MDDDQQVERPSRRVFGDDPDRDLQEGFLDACKRAAEGAPSMHLLESGEPTRALLGVLQPLTLHQVESVANTARESAEVLANALRYGSVDVRRAASAALDDIVHTLAAPYRGRVSVPPRGFSQLGELERVLRHVRDRFVSSSSREAGAVVRSWTVLGFFTSLVAAIALIKGDLILAGLLLLFRTVVSISMPTPGFPIDIRGRAASRVSWRGCVIGHMSDAVALSGVAGYLLLNGAIGWGLLAALVPVASLGATVFRLAAAQGGVVLGRLYFERLARNGILIAGLLGIGAAHAGSAYGFSLVAICSAGAAAYALGEVLRTLAYTSRRARDDTRLGAAEAFARRLANVIPVVDAVVYGSARPTSESAGPTLEAA